MKANFRIKFYLRQSAQYMKAKKHNQNMGHEHSVYLCSSYNFASTLRPCLRRHLCASFACTAAFLRPHVMQSRKGNKTQNEQNFFFLFLFSFVFDARPARPFNAIRAVISFSFSSNSGDKQYGDKRLGIVKTRKLFAFLVRQLGVPIFTRRFVYSKIESNTWRIFRSIWD